jgi:hypothetical protein
MNMDSWVLRQKTGRSLRAVVEKDHYEISLENDLPDR